MAAVGGGGKVGCFIVRARCFSSERAAVGERLAGERKAGGRI